MRITEDIREVIKASRLCFLATVNEDNSPNLSPKASLQVWDNEHLIFANIASPQSVKNIVRQPQVCINVVDFYKRRGYRFFGQAKVLGRGSHEYESVSKPFWDKNGKNYPIHSVVKIRINRIEAIHSPAYDYGSNITEEKLSQQFQTLYNNEDTF